MNHIGIAKHAVELHRHAHGDARDHVFHSQHVAAAFGQQKEDEILQIGRVSVENKIKKRQNHKSYLLTRIQSIPASAAHFVPLRRSGTQGT